MNIINLILSAVNFLPGWKRKISAVMALGLALVAAWNTAAPELGVDFVIQIPEFVNAAVLALLGVGAANADANNAPKP